MSLLAAAAKLRPALHHAQILVELIAGNPQLFGNDVKHFALVGM